MQCYPPWETLTTRDIPAVSMPMAKSQNYARKQERRVVVIIPAHNEGGSIAATLDALDRQTRKPDEVYVFTDNCTDNTAEIAASFGVSVVCTVDNSDRKAGVLNRATSMLMPGMSEDDIFMGFDADSAPGDNFIANATKCIEKGYGAVGATFHARKGGGFWGQLQRSEFARFAQHQHRKRHCDVLSGTGWAIPVGVLRTVAATRADGQVYDVRHIVEDYELTLAIQTLGYKTVSPSQCRVTTDVMESVRNWKTQRMRWQTGTLTALKAYGWTSVTRSMITRQIGTYLFMLAMPAVVTYLMWSFFLFGLRGIDPINAPLYATGMGVVVAEQAWQARKAGWLAVAMTLLVVPDYIYSMARTVVYIRSAYRVVRGHAVAWGAGTEI